MEIKTNIFYFNKNNGDKIKLKDCIILREFMYNRNNFTLLEKNNIFWVCVIGDNEELYSIWSRNKQEDGSSSINTVLSLFRKEYDKNNISNDLINKFLKMPLKTSLLMTKKKTKKKTMRG